MMRANSMPLPTTQRALELGAAFIEDDLRRMRVSAIARDAEAKDGRVVPITHCFEHDLMKCAEWAAAAATLRAMARQAAGD